MNGYLAYINTKSVQSRPGSKAILFLFVVLFFTILLLFLLDAILYIRSEQSVCSRIIDDDGQWRENVREGEKDHILYNHTYHKERHNKFNVQCTHISTYTSLMVSKVHIGHPFCKKESIPLYVQTLVH